MANMGKMGAAALMGALLSVGAAHATDPVTKCQEAKLKAQGKLQLCLTKNSAKVLGGKADASAACQSKFQAALSRAEHIAVAAGTTACRFIDNGDGTVSDLDTGLQWEKKDNNYGDSDPHGVVNPYKWCDGAYLTFTCTNPTNPPDGTAFTDFLAKLNCGASTDGGASTPITGCFAGHCDWRLPSIVELQGIINPTQCTGVDTPCVDPIFGPEPLEGGYWSATAVTGQPDTVYGIVVTTAHVVTSPKNGDGVYARAVRGAL